MVAKWKKVWLQFHWTLNTARQFLGGNLSINSWAIFYACNTVWYEKYSIKYFHQIYMHIFSFQNIFITWRSDRHIGSHHILGRKGIEIEYLHIGGRNRKNSKSNINNHCHVRKNCTGNQICSITSSVNGLWTQRNLTGIVLSYDSTFGSDRIRYSTIWTSDRIMCIIGILKLYMECQLKELLS